MPLVSREQISLNSCVLFSSAELKVKAFVGALQSHDVLLDKVCNHNGSGKPELKTTNTTEIVDRKFDDSLAAYHEHLVHNPEMTDSLRGQLVMFAAMDLNPVLCGVTALNKQNWQTSENNFGNARDIYARMITELFKSTAQGIVRSDDVKNTIVPMSLYVNEVERFGIYKIVAKPLKYLKEMKHGGVQIIPAGPKIFVRNKAFIRFMVPMDDTGMPWGSNKASNGKSLIGEYVHNFDPSEVGKELAEIPWGIAWERFLKLLPNESYLTFDLPGFFPHHLDSFEKMSNGFHQVSVRQATDAIENTVYCRPDSVITIKNYPKESK